MILIRWHDYAVALLSECSRRELPHLLKHETVFGKVLFQYNIETIGQVFCVADFL